MDIPEDWAECEGERAVGLHSSDVKKEKSKKRMHDELLIKKRKKS